jgi:hypothetical protein
MKNKKLKTEEEKIQQKLQLEALLENPDVLEEIFRDYRKGTLEIEFDEDSQEFFYELCVEGSVETTDRIISRDGLDVLLRIRGGFTPPPPIRTGK